MFEFKSKHENHSATVKITHFGDSSKHNTCDYLVCGSSLRAVFWPQSSVASH